MEKSVLLKKLGKRITSLRTEKKLSQSDLARLTDKDRQSIHRLEKGEINPSIFYLSEVANALKMKLTDLFDF